MCECLLWRYRSAVACCRGRDSGCSRPGYGISHPRGGYLVCTRTQEKGAVTPQETQPDLPMGVQGSAAEAWVGGGLLQGWGTECSSECMGPLEGGRHYLHYLHHSLASIKQQGGNTPHPSTETWIKDLLTMALPIK